MKWIKNLSIGAKLITGFSIMILLMGIIGFTGYRSAANINQNLNDIFAVRLPSINYLLQADRDLQQLLVAERSMIFANSKSDVFEKLVSDYKENLEQTQQRWEKYKALPATDEEKALMPQYDQAREAWQDISQRIVAGRVADTREGRRKALDLTLGQAKEKFENMRSYLDQLTDINLGIAQKASEAARAGDAGAGFAVVADEVRNLAMRAADAAKNTAALIEGTIKKVNDGSDLVTETNESFEEVAERSSKVVQLVAEISAASNEQAQGIEQVNNAVAEMDKLTQQNAANAEESASASEEMSTQARQMKAFVGDLVALVAGSRNKYSLAGARQRTAHAVHSFGERRGNKTVALERPAPIQRTERMKQATPEQNIPLEDDFNDF